MEHYVITIARGFGSGGKEIGSRLAERLGIPCYESQILRMASEYSGINERLFNEADERLKSRKKFLGYLKKVPFTSIAEPYMKAFTSDVNLFNIQSQIIRQLVMGVDADEAAKMIEKTDKYRADYYNYYTQGGIWTNPVNYDMTLNSARVGRENCVDVIEQYIKLKFGRSSECI